jgi:hypothetical protein
MCKPSRSLGREPSRRCHKGSEAGRNIPLQPPQSQAPIGWRSTGVTIIATAEERLALLPASHRRNANKETQR